MGTGSLPAIERLWPGGSPVALPQGGVVHGTEQSAQNPAHVSAVMDRQLKQTACFGTEGGSRPPERHYEASGAPAPLPDITCRVVVGGGSDAAADTLEVVSVQPIPYVDQTAGGAFPAGVTRIDQHFPTIFRAPEKVIFQAENRPGIGPVSWLDGHIASHTPAAHIAARVSCAARPASPPPPEGGGFLRRHL